MENKYLRNTIFSIACILFLTVSLEPTYAQTFGITTPGTTNYPTTNVGSTSNGTDGSNSSGYLIADRYSTTVPLTAIQIRTYGNAGGSAKVTIYNHDAVNNRPNNKLFTEVASTVNNGSWTSITISNIYLAPGTYWIVANMNTDQGIRRTLNIGISGQRRRSNDPYSYSSAFPANGSSITWFTSPVSLDDMYFIGVPIEGYAKATKATLSANATINSVSFYSHATGNARLAIYGNSGSAPGSKLWESSSTGVSASAWTTVNISAGLPATLSLTSGTYWLAWQWDSPNSGPSYTAGVAGDGNFIALSYGGFPASWTGGTSSSEKWSMYATYCVAPTVAITGSKDPSCYAGANDEITVTVTGGTPPYTFSINNGSTYPYSGTSPKTITGLTAGTLYQVRVKDANGCESAGCP